MTGPFAPIVDRTAVAHCEDCVEGAPKSTPDNRSQWAQRHADNTGHTVHVTTTTVRAYKSKRPR